jgi:rod shape-determining protein MreD
MRIILVQFFRFLFFVLAQSLIFNQLEIGFGVHPMIYPLFIVLLPFEINAMLLLLIACIMGLSIDALSNTYGLHTTSLLVLAYLRPFIFKIFAPRDGYDSNKEGSV